jgi:hypothetical protein
MEYEFEMACLEKIQLLLYEAMELVDAAQSMPVIEY